MQADCSIHNFTYNIVKYVAVHFSLGGNAIDKQEVLVYSPVVAMRQKHAIKRINENSTLKIENQFSCGPSSRLPTNKNVK